MNWLKLESVEQLKNIKEASKESPVLIFKHSTSCSISRAALSRLERNWNNEEMREVKPFFLDLLAHRSVSNQIAAEFSVEHQSPQVLLIENGNSVNDWSHMGIDYKEILAATKSASTSAKN